MARPLKLDIKVVMLGQQSVGKSCLLDRYITGVYDECSKNTIGAAFAAKKVKVNKGQVVSLGIWDTAGAERFDSLSRVYYHGAKAAVVCFQVNDEQSFRKAQFWVGELREHEPHCTLFLAATKVDMLDEGEGEDHNGTDGSLNSARSALSARSLSARDPQVPEADVRAFAERVQAKVFYTSAKTGKGLNELFQTVAEDVARTLPPSVNGLGSPGSSQGREAGIINLLAQRTSMLPGAVPRSSAGSAGRASEVDSPRAGRAWGAPQRSQSSCC